MLEPMSTPNRTRSAGFTMIELMVVVVLAGVVLMLAVPSFREVIARNRLEGVAGEFFTDLQYARSEAVARNANVGLVIGASQTCYTIYQDTDPAGSCDCAATPACAVGGPTEIKTVSFAGSNVIASAGLLTFPLTFLFEPLRGGNSGAASVTLGTSLGANTWQLQADVTPVGRVKTCSPSGTFKGYPSC